VKHFLSSLVNAGLVTIFTSGTMTLINAPHFAFLTWFQNWLVSWSIVFTYVFFFAPRVSRAIHGTRRHADAHASVSATPPPAQDRGSPRV
jgi:hypothetical protein